MTFQKQTNWKVISYVEMQIYCKHIDIALPKPAKVSIKVKKKFNNHDL